MTVGRLGLAVSDAANVDRVNSILVHFVGGFNQMLTQPTVDACRRYCDRLPVLFQPFAHEGVAMGYTLRHLFRYDAGRFEESLVKVRPDFRYLYYVGLGFWSGMRGHALRRLHRVTAGLDPMYRYLCYDGYGFKHAFFDYPGDPSRLRRLDGLSGYERNAAYHGVGRAMFFLFMDRPDLMIDHVASLGDMAEEAAAGIGLAAVFVNPDRLQLARELARAMPARWRPHFHLGMCFGLKARSINNLDQFETDMAEVDEPIRDAVFASIRECDRVELLVRSEDRDDGYREWRQRVTAWMTGHIVYPLSEVVPAADRAHAETEDAMAWGARR
jgi:hypothetical protein